MGGAFGIKPLSDDDRGSTGGRTSVKAKEPKLGQKPLLDLLMDLVRERQLGTPINIFAMDRREKTETLLRFIDRAREEGHPDSAMRELVRAYKYANRLRIWQDTSKDQAPSAIVCSNTSALDWFDILEGGKPLIENGVLYNGIFGNRTSVHKGEDVDRIEDLTQALYIIKHGIAHNNPLPAYVMIGGRSRENVGFEKAVEHAQARFEKLKEDSERTPDPIYGTHMEFVNPHTDKIVKLPIMGMIYDKPTGKFHIIEFEGREAGHPQDAVTWLSKPANIAKLLGIEKRELERLRAEAFPELIGRPWSEKLLKNPEYAQMAHSYETITRHRKNLEEREADSENEIRLMAFLSARRKQTCVDSRQSGGHGRSLGAMMTREEMRETIDREEVEELQPTVHLKCGYLTTILGLHEAGRELGRIFSKKGKDREELDAWIFLGTNMRRLMTGEYAGTLAEADLFEQHMASLNVGLKMHEILRSIFVLNDQLTRNALRHAYKNGVIEMTPARIPRMKAAAAVDRMIEKFGCENEVSPELYMVLVTEEAARQMQANAPKDSEKTTRVLVEEFRQGRTYEVPPQPRTRAELLESERTDAFLRILLPRDIVDFEEHRGLPRTFDVLELVRASADGHHH